MPTKVYKKKEQKKQRSWQIKLPKPIIWSASNVRLLESIANLNGPTFWGSGKKPMARQLSKPWLTSFLEYVKELESPPNFKLWSGISALSSVLKKHVYMTRGFYKIYPNKYIILVGPPGIGKGTSINPAIDIVKRSGAANYLSDRITAEKILVKLEQGFSHQQINPQGGQVLMSVGDKSATIISTELPIFLGSSDWMIPLLCEMWEKGEFNYDTKTKGTVQAKDLCVSLIGACVPDYIRNLSKDSTAFITSGFSSRCIFVFANQRGTPVSWPEVNGNVSKLENDLKDDLIQIATLKGEFKFTTDARQLWDHFYQGSLNINEFESDVVSNFRARMVSHIVKLSMILSASEKDDLIITRDNLYNAIAMVEEVRLKLDVAFRSIGESPLAVAQDRILRYIETNGVVTRSKILRDNMRHITDEDLTKVLYVLEATGYVTEDTIAGKLTYRSLDKSKYAVKGAGKP